MAKGRVKIAYGNALIAGPNAAAGVIIVPGRAGRQITVLDCWLRAKGGNATQCTSIDLTDTSGTVTVASYAAAALTTAAGVVRAGATNTTVTNLLAACTMGEGIKLITVGTDETTMTSIDYSIKYTDS